tara:strand:+ start:2444 stop:2641 length:198 start_codon:yes stop_codon:yes gene_type:complete
LVEVEIVEVLQVLEVEVLQVEVGIVEAQEEVGRIEIVLEVGTAVEEIKVVQKSWYLRLVEIEVFD